MKLFQAYMHLIIFLSLTATSPAVAKLTKTGCDDTCGNNVKIPYPFGIGAKCSVNPWYTIECNNSKPYISLNHLEVLGVNLENQTVTVSMPRVMSDCQNLIRNSSKSMSMNLDGSPFFFSKSHNKFMFEGCGTANLMDNGKVITGCSAACLNVTLNSGNNCYGIGCCRTAIPHYLRSYSIRVTGLREEDRACGSAFLVDEASYDEGWFSDPFISKNSSFVPVSLLWTLTDSNQITCCYKYEPRTRKVGMFNGTPVDTLKCEIPLEGLLEENPYLEDGCSAYESTPKYAKTGCNDTCGNVRIPYPFGIGANCSVNKWYNVDCNNSKPYLSTLNHLEVLGVSLENRTVTLSTPMISDCQNPVQNSSEIMGVDVTRSPFLFSKSHNKFVFEGCGSAAMIMDNGSVLTGCSTACGNVTLSDRKNCFGIGCCQTTIPHYLRSYNINLISLEEENGGCGPAFLVDEASYEKGRISDPFIFWNNSFVPVSLMWTLDQITCCKGYADQARVRVDTIDGTTTTDICECHNYNSEKVQGNLYLIDGCNYIDEVNNEPTEECRQCEYSGGKCEMEDEYDVDGLLYNQNFNCYSTDEFDVIRNISLAVMLGLCISMGVAKASYVLYKWIKKLKEKRQRKRFFKRNGGLLLKQQEEADSSLVDKTIHFTSRELQKATDNFNENRILGRGGQGTVYKGMLVDGRIVAVKKSKVVDESQLEHFINEVTILSQINHRNVVKLLGCCLETDVPVLVSEFIPNGTLYDRLHNKIDEFPFSLHMRLQIATEVASAVAYLHSAASIPIYHRDIKTTNILLDEKYRAKVSDFGTSRFVTIDQTHLTTLVKGTFGYLDPEYFQSSQFTEKSDVYSFGVVLVELLTGERPISLTRFGENRSLATHFMLAMEEERVMSIFDAIVIKGGTRDELLIIANLAMRCLNMSGKYRPTMKEVATELENMRRSHVPSMVQKNTGPVMYGEELSILDYGESSSTLLSFNIDSVTQ